LIKIIDNFLDKSDFLQVKEALYSNNFPWFAHERANDASKFGEYHFLHHLIHEGKLNSPKCKFVVDMISHKLALFHKKDIIVTRARASLFTVDKKSKGLGFHKDVLDSFDYKVLLFYMENSNGFTEFKDGKKVESVENRALIFDGHLEHQTLTQTNITFRRNINFNYRLDNV